MRERRDRPESVASVIRPCQLLIRVGHGMVSGQDVTSTSREKSAVTSHTFASSHPGHGSCQSRPHTHPRSHVPILIPMSRSHTHPPV